MSQEKETMINYSKINKLESGYISQAIVDINHAIFEINKQIKSEVNNVRIEQLKTVQEGLLLAGQNLLMIYGVE